MSIKPHGKINFSTAFLKLLGQKQQITSCYDDCLMGRIKILEGLHA